MFQALSLHGYPAVFSLDPSLEEVESRIHLDPALSRTQSTYLLRRWLETVGLYAFVSKETVRESDIRVQSHKVSLVYPIHADEHMPQ